jgi:NADPH2 dehydrogenase
MPHLFEPFTHRGCTFRNRIVFPPIAQELCSPEGEVTRKLLDHYVARAKGGAGFVMLEHSYIERRGRYSTRQTGLHHDGLVYGLRRVVEAVHDAGVPVGIQLAHAGARACATDNHEPAVGPSAVAQPGGEPAPRALGAAEIAEVCARFAAAARRALAARFDLVEIHGAHGYLLSQFLSPLTNQRTDRYGGDLEGRSRLLCEVVAAVRAAVGERPIWFRLGADDRLPGGLTLQEGARVGQALAQAGVDVLDVSGGLCGSRPHDLPGPGYFAYASRAVKAAAGVPVVAVGGISDPRDADRLVRDGSCDLVAVGRAILADAEWPAKAAKALGAG